MARSDDPRLVLLAGAADLALETARHDAADELAPPPPPMLRPLLSWRRGTRVAAARSAALNALDDAEFRARVRAHASADDVNQASWLMIDRPPGWDAAIAEALAAMVDERAQRSVGLAAARDRELADEVTALRQQVAEQAAALSSQIAQLQVCDIRIGELSAELERERDAARMARDDRQVAVRDLKKTERRLADRTAQWKAAVATPAPRPPEPIGAEFGSEVLAEFDAMAAAHLALGERVAALDAVLRGGRSASVDQAAELDSERSGAPARRRRRPVRMGRGLRADTAAGVDWLLRRPGAVVLLDGYNITMLAWPTLSSAEQRGRLERVCADVAVRTSVAAVIVFDGDGDGGRPPRSVGSEVRVRFTSADVEADDEILDLIEQVPIGQPIIVVSNDQRVIDGAVARGANTVSSTTWVDMVAGGSPRSRGST